ncbi:NAD(P)/FAD-dependent oxidoreductase [Dyadobacter sediminis]|uniref:FAD-binding oxidoreductase n=1 Tax=Dyadobacter sediminis TaxID=1493691 RepID=A0A5R9KF21_9BACT|nr:FAD-dependent oxidoreductase [Dyadobacter sediminis]TLU94704.1 FAD-binding oxidoreductase [Dyadobacter sediminis]GGB88905.1 FAD-dependent oxidoreductase [Dyadobacter sediminis]
MSKNNPDFDYLIIGQGVAGTSLAWHLLDAGKKIQIAGDLNLPSSSKVAAGIFNPLTGKKLVKTWLADALFPYASAFYTNLEKRLGAKFFHSASIFRPFRSIEEQNTYLARTADPTILPYVGPQQTNDLRAYVDAAYGGLEVIQSGWIDLPVLLDSSRDYFIEKNLYTEERFQTADLNIQEEYIIWKNRTFGKVIFCQGFMAHENAFFNWLPFTPVKGQILEITTEKALGPEIINQGIFILPVTEFKARIGATYSWDPLDWEPTAAATAELEDKLQSLLKIPYRVESETAGIRPSVKDRRPLVGVHPEYHKVGIFNGLGTKGVTLAPYFANQFVQHLENGKELNPLVNINRYFSLYFR